MLENFVPLDTLFSFSKPTLFKIEKILQETDIQVESFANFMNSILNEDYNSYKDDESLMKLVYWYIFDKVVLLSDYYLYEELEELETENRNIEDRASLEELIEVETINGVANYICDNDSFDLIKQKLKFIPPEKQNKTLKWFINEFQRCTNCVIN
jgi:hypothetical protein